MAGVFRKQEYKNPLLYLLNGGKVIKQEEGNFTV
jgi:hypothetical protein